MGRRSHTRSRDYAVGFLIYLAKKKSLKISSGGERHSRTANILLRRQRALGASAETRSARGWQEVLLTRGFACWKLADN